jgi:hypothetical protein
MIMKKQIKQMEYQMRLYTMRTWAAGLAIASGVTAFLTPGFSIGALSNPETWSSAFAVFSNLGFLKESILPLLGFSAIFALIALVLHLRIKRMENSK